MKTYRNVVPAVAFIIFAFAVLSCDRHYPYPDEDIRQMIWDTGGGGDLRFEIEPDAENFDITVTRCNFVPVSREIVLTSRDGDVHALVESIFDKSRNLYNDTYIPAGATGTWTSITLVFESGRELTIDNIAVQGGDLLLLYEFVDDRMSS